MNKLSLFSLSLATALTLSACGADDQPAVAEVETTPAARSLLAYVPSDTPYLVANLQPMPGAVIDANFERAEPLMKEVQARISTMKADIDGGGTVTGDEFTDTLLLALLDEFDGKLNREGFESLGWNLDSTSAIYGMGAFPVARVALSDPAVMKATIMRVLEKAGIDAPESEFQGVKYWRLATDDSEEMPVGIYVSILEDHMAVGAYPQTSEAEFLPLFLGVEMPASDAAERLAALNAKHGYTPYGSGYMDFHRMADEFLDPEARTARALMSVEGVELDSFSEQCTTELHGMIDHMPTMNFGLTAVDVKLFEYEALFEMPAALATELTGLVAPVPQVEGKPGNLGEFAFGIKVGAVRDFVSQKAQAIVDSPYQCEAFTDINEQASQLIEKMNQPIPPFVNNFRGLRFSIEKLEINPSAEIPIPEDVRGLLAVHVEQPEMFVGMAQMFLPDLSSLTLAPGEPPVQIPESLLSMPGLVAFAAMSDDAIAMSVGDGVQEQLGGFLDRDAGPAGRLMSVEYDIATYSEFQLKMLENIPQEGDDAMMAISRASLEANRDSGDRNRFTIDVTPEGMVLTNRMTYK